MFGAYFSSVENENDFIAFDNGNKGSLPFAITEATTVYFLGASVDTDGNRSAATNSSVQITFYPPAPAISSAHIEGGAVPYGGVNTSGAYDSYLYVEFVNFEAGWSEIYVSDRDFTLDDILSFDIGIVSETGKVYGNFREYYLPSGLFVGAENLYIKSLQRRTENNIVILTGLSNVLTLAPAKSPPVINSISVVGNTVTIDFNAEAGAEYEVYTTYEQSALHSSGQNHILATTSASPVTFECIPSCPQIAIAEVDGDHRSILMYDNISFVSGLASASHITSVQYDNRFRVGIPAKATGVEVYYAMQPINDLASATLLATLDASTAGGEYIHKNVTQTDSEGRPVTHYYSLLPYLTSDSGANKLSTGVPTTINITSDPIAFSLLPLSDFSQIRGSLVFNNGSLMFIARGALHTYVPDIKTSTIVSPTKFLALGNRMSYLLQADDETLIYAHDRFALNSGNVYVGVGKYTYSDNSSSLLSIIKLNSSFSPKQIVEDDNTVYLSVAHRGDSTGIVRSLKSTTDGSSTTMIDGLDSAPKMVVDNDTLYYTSGTGIYTLPVTATTATFPLVVSGTFMPNITDFIVVGSDIYYLTAGAGTGTLYKNLPNPDVTALAERISMPIATGFIGARKIQFANNRLFWSVANHLYTMVVNLDGSFGNVESVVDTEFSYFVVEQVDDPSAAFRTYLATTQRMIELTSDHIHPVMPIPDVPVISAGTMTNGIVRLVNDADTLGSDYYEIYINGLIHSTLVNTNITGLTIGVSYDIRVKACNINGCSALSNQITATPLS